MDVRVERWRKLSAKKLMLLNCGVRLLRVCCTERRSNQSILKEISPGCSLKDWCWSWNSNTLANSWEELTHWKRPWCWEGLGAGGEGDNRGWDGWVASLTGWAWVWVNSRSLWWTGRPGRLQFIGSQIVGHDWATELNWRHLQACSWNKGLSRASWLWANPYPARDRPARAARAGRGQSWPQRGILHQTASRLRCSPRFLGILDGRHLPVGSQPEISSPEETHGTPEKAAHCTPRKPSVWDREGINCSLQLGATLRTKHLVPWAAWTWDRCKTKAQPNPHLCGVLENPNLRGLDLGSACKPGPTSDSSARATWSLSSVDWESTHALSGGKPSVAESLWAHASDICLQCFSLPKAWFWTREPRKKWPPSHPLCQGGN